MWQLTMYCHWRPPDAMPLLTLNVLGPQTPDLISMVTFTFTMRRHLIWLASAPFISSRLAMFGWVRVWSTMQNLRRVGENSDPILSCLWTKVHKICRPKMTIPALFCDLGGCMIHDILEANLYVRGLSPHAHPLYTPLCNSLFSKTFSWRWRGRPPKPVLAVDRMIAKWASH